MKIGSTGIGVVRRFPVAGPVECRSFHPGAVQVIDLGKVVVGFYVQVRPAVVDENGIILAGPVDEIIPAAAQRADPRQGIVLFENRHEPCDAALRIGFVYNIGAGKPGLGLCGGRVVIHHRKGTAGINRIGNHKPGKVADFPRRDSGRGGRCRGGGNCRRPGVRARKQTQKSGCQDAACKSE